MLPKWVSIINTIIIRLNELSFKVRAADGICY